MGWVKDALKLLEASEIARIRPHGGSMCGRIESGQLVELAKVPVKELSADDVVLVRWRGNYLLHLIKAIEPERVLIGNNLGKVNGWVATEAVIAKVISVTD